MRITLDISIVCKATNALRDIMRKEFEADVSFTPGMHLVDHMWEVEREITGVIYNPDEPSLYLRVSPGIEECPTKEDAEEMEQLYLSAGWRGANEWK